jgi:uncharacterized cupredoxin-like copper-binding protein
MKRILSLLAAAAVAAVTLFVVVPLAGARTAATTVKVTAKEYKFTLSTKTARHGTVVFKVVNKGHFKHDFKIAGKKTKLLGKNQSATLTVTLKKGKSYPYICTVPGHAQLGMKGTFKAT